MTYIIRELKHSDIQEAEKDVSLWNQMIEDLLGEVMSSVAGFELRLRPLEEVRNWTKEMARRVQDSLLGQRS